MYDFKHKNYGILLNCIFKDPYKLLFHACYSISDIFHVLVTVEVFFFIDFFQNIHVFKWLNTFLQQYNKIFDNRVIQFVLKKKCIY